MWLNFRKNSQESVLSYVEMMLDSYKDTMNAIEKNSNIYIEIKIENI